MHNLLDTQALVEVIIAQAMRHINSQTGQEINLQGKVTAAASQQQHR